MAGQELWLVASMFIAAYMLPSLCSLLSSIATNPLLMQLSDPRLAATQFTIYNSLSNLPVSLGAMLFANFGGTDALGSVMLAAAGLFVTAAVFLVFIRVGNAVAHAEPVPWRSNGENRRTQRLR